jgi:protein TonB
MFQNTLVEDMEGRQWTKGVGFVSVSAAIGVWIIYSIFDYAPFPVAQLRQLLMEPPSFRPAAVQVISAQRAPMVSVRLSPETLYQPRAVPNQIGRVVEEVSPPIASGDVPVGVPGILPQISVPGIAPPPPPPRTEEKTMPEPVFSPVRVGGYIQAAKLIAQPKPAYPPLARQARIQGAVRLEAVISQDGAIENLKVVSGHPLLVQAALDAVAQWRYQPTLLNGVPVMVVTTIDVSFTLAQ